MPPSEREADVRAVLADVLDPELDESVVDLGFVSRVAVDGDAVAVDFRLPTFWCAANFAWIMAEDMRAALAALPWATHIDVRLVDHFSARRINEGVAAGRSFRETFGEDAADDLATLRETFRRKAYLGRMSRLIEALRDRGWSDERILATRVGEIAELDDDLEPVAARFLQLRAMFGGPSAAADVAFHKPDGTAIDPGQLAATLRDIRMTRRSVEANGEMCRAMLKARIEAPVPVE